MEIFPKFGVKECGFVSEFTNKRGNKFTVTMNEDAKNRFQHLDQKEFTKIWYEYPAVSASVLVPSYYELLKFHIDKNRGWKNWGHFIGVEK